MNGAESLVPTLVVNGVEICFTNPSTSDMHSQVLRGEPYRVERVIPGS